MPNSIPLITIPAPVIQLNNDTYLADGQYSPRTLNIPCGTNAWVDDIQHWAIPIKDYGICTNVFFQPAVGDYPPGTEPTPDSLLVLRVRDKYYPGFTWWVICTIEEYYAACQTCCDDTPVPIPDPTLPMIVPCQKICEAQDAEGNYFVTFAAPTLAGGENYRTYGQFNEDELASFDSTSLDDLVTDLNADYDEVGTPTREIIWTRSGNTIIGTVQYGAGEDDSFCLLITAIVP